MNVELPEERTQQIIKKIAPLTRLVAGTSPVVCDLIIRRVAGSWAGDTYYVMVRLTADGRTVYAVAQGHRLASVINEAQGRLRRTILQEQHDDMARIARLQQAVQEKYFRHLFA